MKDRLEYLKSIPEDEPVFILRAKDKHAPATIMTWAGLVAAPVSRTQPASKESQEKARDAIKTVAAIRKWQEDHPSVVKIPD